MIDPDRTRVTTAAWAAVVTRRRRINMPVDQLARAIGYSPNSVTSWDKGRGTPTLAVHQAALAAVTDAENELIAAIEAGR